MATRKMLHRLRKRNVDMKKNALELKDKASVDLSSLESWQIMT